jgi:mannosyltransferase
MARVDRADPGSGKNGIEREDLVFCALAFVAALLLRLIPGNRESVWLDEANTILIARRSLGGIIQALRQDGNPPLYYVLLHGWMALAGDGETALRLLSAVLGAALPPALYLTARRLLGRPAAVTAAILSVLWPLHIYYSGQIRMYTLLPLLALAYMAALFRALDVEASPPDPGAGPALGRWWILVVAAGIAVIWTHNYGMFLVAATPVVWLIRGPRTGRAARAVALSLAGVLLLDLLWLPVVLAQSGTAVGVWIARDFSPGAPLQSFLLFAAGYNYPPYLQALSGALPTAPAAVAWLVMALSGGIWLALRAGRGPGRPQDRDEADLCATSWSLLAFLLVPMAIPYFLSLLLHPIYLAGRYETVAYPAFALLLGAGAQAAWTHRGRTRGIARASLAALLIAYVGLALVTLSHEYGRPPERTEENVARRLSQWLAPGDVVITTGLGRAPLEYYLGRLGQRGVVLESYPRAMAAHLGWYDTRGLAAHPELMEREAEDLAGALRGFKGKVFLVDHTGTLELYRLQEPLRAALARYSRIHRVLLRVGPDPKAGPVYELSVYQMSS